MNVMKTHINVTVKIISLDAMHSVPTTSDPMNAVAQMDTHWMAMVRLAKVSCPLFHNNYDVVSPSRVECP